MGASPSNKTAQKSVGAMSYRSKNMGFADKAKHLLEVNPLNAGEMKMSGS
jgi:hypothetical protein